MYEVKTKSLIICMVSVRLICTFIFAYAKSRISYEVPMVLLI